MGGVARELNLLQRASGEHAGLTALPQLSQRAPPDDNVQALDLRLLDLSTPPSTRTSSSRHQLASRAPINVDLGPLCKMLWIDLGALEPGSGGRIDDDTNPGIGWIEPAGRAMRQRILRIDAADLGRS
jgi:hypothetical protein